MGGRSHPKLNISGRPIAKKYSDGKVKRTLKRRLKVLETVKRETNGTSVVLLWQFGLSRAERPCFGGVCHGVRVVEFGMAFFCCCIG
jgi:hypothetical protein